MLKASKYEASHKIRFLRVVVGYDVDRMQVYRQRCHSRALLIARPLFAFRVWRYIRSAIYGHFTFFSSCLPYSGDYSTGVPPLPIPFFSVVKPCLLYCLLFISIIKPVQMPYLSMFGRFYAIYSPILSFTKYIHL